VFLKYDWLPLGTSCLRERESRRSPGGVVTFKQQNGQWRETLIIVFGVLLAGLAGPAAAEPPDAGHRGTELLASPEPAPGGDSGRRSLLSDALAHALDQSADGLEISWLPGGGAGLHLEGRGHHALVVRVRPDGGSELVCVNHAEHAERLLYPKRLGIDAEPAKK
jgi:hypothetical protein